MQIKSVAITNCKSFLFRELITFDDKFTILVGPNGGGKSNTLDILTIILRKFFLPAYRIRDGEEYGRRWREVDRQEPFSDIRRFLEAHDDSDAQETKIELKLTVGTSDIKNIQTILARRDELLGISSNFRNTPYGDKLNILDNWKIDELSEGQELTYVILNGSLQQDADDVHRIFREYLYSLNFFLMLGGEGSIDELRPSFIYFSPYRGTLLQDMRANLSSEQFFNQLIEYSNTTSQSQTSLIKIASLYFAEKKRRFEMSAREEGYLEKWSSDHDIALVSSYMSKLGYSWELTLVDANRNVYEIELKKGSRNFAISKASSGEKEILNFLLGIFALRTEGGLIIIDEPELHLHPRWQATLRNLLSDLAFSTKNQIILSTHSPVFITPQTIGNIRRVARDQDNSTRITVVTGGNSENEKDLLHILNSHNNERVFFADKVVLVEGIHDRLVFGKLIDLYSNAGNLSDIVEVVEVYGKGNFKKYHDFMASMKIPVCTVADLDYALNLEADSLQGLLITEWKRIDAQVLAGKKSKDRLTLAEHLDVAISSSNLERLKDFWSYIKGRHLILKENLTLEEKEKFRKVLDKLKKNSIYILSSGEIEDYLPNEFRVLAKTIELIKLPHLLNWLETISTNQNLLEIESICFSVLGISDKDQHAVREKVLQILREL